MKKIALLFPGQGSQYVGMSKEICDDFAVARQTFEEANDVLGFNLKKLCLEGSIVELTKTENTQPALLTASVAAFRVYMQEIGIKPHFSAGHSLGEFSALTCSNSMKFDAALKIVRKRGILMQQAADEGAGKMAAVRNISRKTIEEECIKISTEEQPVVVACYNSPNQNVISGHEDAVKKLIEKLSFLGATVVPLNVSAAFHSPIMKQAAENLQLELINYKYNDPEWPVVSNVTGMPYYGSSEIIDGLTKQMTMPVRWQESVEYINSQGVEAVIELGPKDVLKKLMKEIAGDVSSFLLNVKEDVQTLREELWYNKDNKDFERQTKMKIISKCIASVICTRNRNWDASEYNSGVVEPYRKIKEMYENLQNELKTPSDSQVRRAIQMLKTALVTKRVPESQQCKILKNISDQAEELFTLNEINDCLIDKKNEEIA
ncbi:MAG: ACP S-malonyltransferase [Bacillota bacterium]